MFRYNKVYILTYLLSYMAEQDNELLREGGLPTFEVKPSIKLNKGLTGKYGWEIRIVGLDVDELEKIDLEMRKRFGDGN